LAQLRSTARQIPFVPVWLTQHAVEFLLEKVELVVESGITNTFDKHVYLAKQTIASAESDDARKLSIHDRERKADAALQSYLGAAFEKGSFHAEVQAEMVGLLYPHVAHLPVPEALKRKWSVMFVEHTILNIIDLDRLSDAMKYVVSKQHEERAYEAGGALLPG